MDRFDNSLSITSILFLGFRIKKKHQTLTKENSFLTFKFISRLRLGSQKFNHIIQVCGKVNNNNKHLAESQEIIKHSYRKRIINRFIRNAQLHWPLARWTNCGVRRATVMLGPISDSIVNKADTVNKRTQLCGTRGWQFDTHSIRLCTVCYL